MILWTFQSAFEKL